MSDLPLFDRGFDDPFAGPREDDTWRVGELCREIKTLLGTAFGSLWVVGEVQRPKRHRSGHLYFELVEKGDGDRILGKLDCVIWKTDFARVERTLAAADQEIAEGVEIRCRAGVDFWGGGGRLQLVVREVDPVFTLGLLARRRQETLAALERSGLLERNKALPLSELPLTLALITSEGSAAYHDFLATLGESGYGFRVLFVHAAVQGRDAERELESALAGLAGVDLACAVVIRGGGSRTDLAAFDTRRVAEAVARSPVPVLVGLGHQIDQSIVDLVAHTSLKTPTKVAELLVEHVALADRRHRELAVALGRAVRDRLRTGHEALGRAERGVELGRARLTRAADRLEDLSRALGRTGRLRLAAEGSRLEALTARLGAAAPRVLARRRDEPERQGRRLVLAARARLGRARAELKGVERLIYELAPERILERGFSITRNAEGRALRDPDEVAPGDRLTTRLAGGELTSRVAPESQGREPLP